MATFADTFESLYSGQPSSEPKPTNREDQRVMILKDELSKAQGRIGSATDAASKDRAIRDVEALNRELGRLGVKAAPAPKSSSFADTFESLYAGQAPAAEAKPKTEAKQQNVGMLGGLYNRFQQAKKDIGAAVIGAGETAAQAVSGGLAAPASAVGGVVGALTSGKYGTQESVQAGQNVARKIQEQMTYQPRTQAGQEMSAALAKAFEASKLPPVGVPELTGMAPLVQPATQQAVSKIQQIPGQYRAAVAEITPTQQLQQQFQAKGGMRSGGAAATTANAEFEAAIAKASPELAAELRSMKPEDASMAAINRQLEGDSLPVRVPLTRGQATQNVNLLSDEMNMRGKNPELATRFNEQNNALKENFSAIRDKAAPDVFGTNHIENAETLIGSYKELDKARTQDISAKYKALRDAAGGDFPINGKAFADNAFSALSKELKSDFVPAPIEKQLHKFAAGEKMTYEQFEAMRTNLAAEMRKAERSGDGNAKAAASIVRQALEDLPLGGDAAALKPLADEARNAAKARFDMLKRDPAYEAAVNDVAPDKFINKYVINGNKRDIETLVNQLGGGTEGHQAVSAAVINWLQDKSISSGNFNQASYNRALKQIEPKLNYLIDPETANNLRTLGRVAEYTQAQPRGSYVNQSNTFVAGAKELAKSGLERGANVMLGAGVVPVGSMMRETAQKRAMKKETQKILKPGAGTKLSDVGKD